jgi:hypothetical protein
MTGDFVEYEATFGGLPKIVNHITATLKSAPIFYIGVSGITSGRTYIDSIQLNLCKSMHSTYRDMLGCLHCGYYNRYELFNDESKLEYYTDTILSVEWTTF